MHMISKKELSRLNLEQQELAKRVEVCSLSANPRYIGGMDVSYWEAGGQEFGVACLVVYDILENKVVHKLNALKTIEFPYKTGYLSYREYEIEALALSSSKHKIDVLMVDGSGLLHPRKAGAAVKLGVEFNIPAIGVIKSRPNCTEFKYVIRQTCNPACDDIYYNGELLGKVVYTKEGRKPLYVSVGNKISLDEAVNIVFKTTKDENYLPLPLRLADIQTHLVRDRYVRTFKEQERKYDPSVLCS